MKFVTFSEKWLKKQEFFIKESTYNYYMFIIRRHLNVYFKQTRLEDFKEELIIEYIKYLLSFGRLDKQGGLSKATANEIILILKIILRDYGIVNMKIRGLSSYEPASKREIFSDTDMKKLKEYLLQDLNPLNYGLLICLYSGIRIGELCGLKYGDINSRRISINRTVQRTYREDGKSRILISTPKSKKSVRVIPKHKNIPVFNENKNHFILTNNLCPMEPRKVRNELKKILNNLNINYKSFHTIRHTFATKLIQNSTDIKAVSEILGHASVATTLDIYVHAKYESKVDIINSI